MSVAGGKSSGQAGLAMARNNANGGKEAPGRPPYFSKKDAVLATFSPQARRVGAPRACKTAK